MGVGSVCRFGYRGILMCWLRDFLRRDDGPTSVEYAVMLALVVAACLVGIQLAGQETQRSFEHSRDELSTFLRAGP